MREGACEIASPVRRPARRALWALAAGVLALGLAGAGTGHAQSLDRSARSYITPFPEGNRYRLAVLGDSLGDGLWSGLTRIFQEDPNLEVVKKSHAASGFVRTDRFDWNANLDAILRSETVHMAVIMIGSNDMQPMRIGGNSYRPDTEEWREAYGERIDRFMRRLKQSQVAIYWVGLPIMRSDAHNRDIRVLNEVFREKAFINGVKFVDTWNGFTDELGRYSAFGPDITGQARRLRAEDGVHFTIAGYVKLAHFVETEVRRDLRVAREERNIPLAGSPEEQARVFRRPVGDERRRDAGRVADAAEPPPAPAPDLVRPRISEAALAGAGSGYAPEGETIVHEIGNGLTALASISPIDDASLLTAQQRLPLTQRPYYRVLIEGEQLAPKQGRADDFTVGPES